MATAYDAFIGKPQHARCRYKARTTYTLVLFLNVVSRLDAWYSVHPELQELAICAAASITDWAIDEGYAVGVYANSIMYMPEEGMPAVTEQEGEKVGPPLEGVRGLEATLAAELKRRRIHLPPASTE